jgi:hypothetical protein
VVKIRALSLEKGRLEESRLFTNDNLMKFVICLLVFLLIAPGTVHAESLSSPNYKLENPELNIDSLGSPGGEASSANYKVLPGGIRLQLPNVPGQPALTNTGGTLYNSLDFIIHNGNNSSDTEFAVAISADDFATTNYIQADNTIGASASWQSYANWGSGTGERVSGLSPSTTYKIKVKARYGPDTETAFSLTATAVTADPSISFSLGSNIVNLGSLSAVSAATATHTMTASSNGAGGYVVYANGPTLSSAGNTITALGTSATASSPGSSQFGLKVARTSGDANGNPNSPYDTNDYAFGNIASTATPLASASQSTSDTTYTVTYLANISGIQPAGSYTTTITYTATGTF